MCAYVCATAIGLAMAHALLSALRWTAADPGGGGRSRFSPPAQALLLIEDDAYSVSALRSKQKKICASVATSHRRSVLSDANFCARLRPMAVS